MPTTPGMLVHREVLEQHPCTHTLLLPPPSPSHHRPARSARLITFCTPEPALWSSGDHEISRAPSAAAQLTAKHRSKRGQSPAGGSRAAPSSARAGRRAGSGEPSRERPEGSGQAPEHPSEDQRPRLRLRLRLRLSPARRPAVPGGPGAPRPARDAAAGGAVPGPGGGSRSGIPGGLLSRSARPGPLRCPLHLRSEAGGCAPRAAAGARV